MGMGMGMGRGRGRGRGTGTGTGRGRGSYHSASEQVQEAEGQLVLPPHWAYAPKAYPSHFSSLFVGSARHMQHISKQVMRFMGLAKRHGQTI